MWLRLTLNPILPKLVLDNRQLPFIFVFCSHIPPFAATVPPTGSPHILISAVPSDIRNRAVNTFRWNQQTSETSVIERVWGDYWEATFSLSASYRFSLNGLSIKTSFLHISKKKKYTYCRNCIVAVY